MYLMRRMCSLRAGSGRPDLSAIDVNMDENEDEQRHTCAHQLVLEKSGTVN